MKECAFLGLGSNVDNRLWYIVQALGHLGDFSNIDIRTVSSVYETEPYGVKNQRNFLNAVVEIQTKYRPVRLLECVKSIEKKLGRVYRGKWREREIDIDILIYGDVEINLPWLKIPHRDMQNRRFVLVPFDEIAPQFELVHSLLESCPDRGQVRLVVPAEELHIQLDPSGKRVPA